MNSPAVSCPEMMTSSLWPGSATLAPGRLAHGCRCCHAHRSSPPRLTSCLAITPRWISLVPSPTIISGASRK